MMFVFPSDNFSSFCETPQEVGLLRIVSVASSLFFVHKGKPETSEGIIISLAEVKMNAAEVCVSPMPGRSGLREG